MGVGELRHWLRWGCDLETVRGQIAHPAHPGAESPAWCRLVIPSGSSSTADGSPLS